MKVVWSVVLLACIFAVFDFASTMTAAASAPQQAAGAAMALFVAIAPYVCARALEKLVAKPAMAVTVTNWPAQPKVPAGARDKAARFAPHASVSHPIRGEGVVIRQEEDGFVIVQFGSDEARMDPEWLKPA